MTASELEVFNHYKHPMLLQAEVVGEGKSLERLATEASIKFQLITNPALEELLERRGFTKRGRSAWSRHLTDENYDSIRGFFRDYLNTFLPASIMAAEAMAGATANARAINTGTLWTRAYGAEPYQSLEEHLGLLGQETLYSMREALGANPIENLNIIPDPEFVDYIRAFNSGINFPSRYETNFGNWLSRIGPAGRQDVFNNEGIRLNKLGSMVIDVSNGVLWIRFVPVLNILNEELFDPIETPNGRIRRQGSVLTPHESIELVDELNEQWHTESLFVNSEDALQLMERIEDSVTVGYSPTSPASALIRRGANVPASKGSAFANMKKGGKPRRIALDRVLTMKKNNPHKEFLIHPGLEDSMNMTSAKPYMGDERLRHYQKEAVGVHLATRLGYLQASSPGLGKTIMQLVGMRERAANIENYRGLIVSEANVRGQWKEELGKWWPEAKGFVLDKGDNLNGVVDALSHTGPAVLIISYTQAVLGPLRAYEARLAEKERLDAMRWEDKEKELRNSPVPAPTVGSVLLDTHWHDLAADEAIAIRNGVSKQNHAMWLLRNNADVANALTATPVNKDVDDLGRLIAWVRNDRYLFSKQKLSSLYDALDDKSAKKLYRSFGNLIFRRDTSVIADELPTTKQEVIYLKPSAAEKALATAAERELKRCFLELVAAVEESEKVDTTDKEQAKKVRETLRSANGAWLGGTQLARMSTSDPAALLRSKSVGAALLTGQGLVEAAMKKEPTKRARFVSDALKRIEKGQQIVVFTEFTSVATTLVKTLKENGIRARAFTGQNGSVRDKARVDFQNGDVDVLVCTKAAERGLTLHKATTIYHYDTPWTLERIIQRTGRAIRIGSENPVVEIVFMVMEGTVEERVTGQLIDQGIASTLVMDYARGANLKKTEAAQALSGLMSTASRGKSKEKHVISFGKKLLAV